MDIKKSNEIIMFVVEQMVKVRKYEVDIPGLQELLITSKKESKLSISEIARTLNVPKTKVEHWFRKDKFFAIPEETIWDSLKSILNLKSTEYDKAIMTIEQQPGKYDKSNRVYLESGIAPTLTCLCGKDNYVVYM